MTAGFLFAEAPAPVAPLAADHRLGPAPPAVEPLDQTYLIRLVRRMLEQQLREGRTYVPEYIPPALSEIRCLAVVTLRRWGERMGTGESDTGPVVRACAQAAEAALAAARKERTVTADNLAAWTIEIELVGPRERIGDGRDTPILLAQHLEPGIHGLGVRVDGKEVLARPSQLLALETLCELDGDLDYRCNRCEIAAADFQDKLGLQRDPPDHKPESVVFLRFRTTHLHEPSPGAEAVPLIAGMRLVQPEEVTTTALLATVDDLARYIRHRQNPDGLFAYEFLPGRNMYWPKHQDWVRQAGTVWALATYARFRGDADSRQALERALAAFSDMATPLAGADRAVYIATPDGRHALGTTALVALALMDGPDAGRHEDLLVGLLNAIAAMQREDGGFRTHFAPSTSVGTQDYYPGEALLAVARRHAATGDGRWRQMCETALPFYLSYFRQNRPPPFVPWQAQAYGQLARTTLLQRYADFVYEMTDAMVDTQIERPAVVQYDPALALYEGAFDVYGTGRAGITTAVYLEGCVDAARTAETLGDRRRAERYREAARKAARFVMQLQFRPQECFFIQSPKEVIGGVRNSPADPTLRIDHAQHALAALLGTARLLAAQTQAAGQ